MRAMFFYQTGYVSFVLHHAWHLAGVTDGSISFSRKGYGEGLGVLVDSILEVKQVIPQASAWRFFLLQAWSLEFLWL